MRCTLFVAHAVVLEAGDNRQLEPMAEAAGQALELERLNIVADTGYPNGEQAERCEQAGLIPHVPAQRSGNTAACWIVVPSTMTLATTVSSVQRARR